MKTNKGFASVAAALIVIAVLAVGVYFAFVKKSEPVTQQQTSDSTSQKQDETAGWKIYNFDGPVDFSIQYSDNVVGGNNGWGVDFSKANEDMAGMSLTKSVYIPGSKNEYDTYKINIGQADGGGGSCIFSDSKVTDIDENFDSDLRKVKFFDFNSNLGVTRRYPDDLMASYAKVPTSIFHLTTKNKEGNFGCGVYSTPVGGIGYELPKNYDPKILEEMDDIVKTIKRK